MQFSRALSLALISSLLLGGLAPVTAQQSFDLDKMPADRTVLPMTGPWLKPIDVLDARNTKAPPVFQVKAPSQAPNVIIILTDDQGFGCSSTFGGVIPTPTLDRLARSGLRYNHFHSTALCSPSRAALLTGRNHHSVNMSGITEIATSYPGATGMIPREAAMLPEILRLNGYSTAHFGKDHLTAAWETSPSGPLTRWPTMRGFDKFYGFLGGETNQWSPMIYDGVTPVENPGKGNPDYHFLNDMTTRAIEWMHVQQSLTPDKPFFMYFAPGAVHAPHHVPRAYIDKYKGKFDEGWDVIRQHIFENQKKLGVIPPDTKLAAKPADIKDWKALSADEKKVFARQAEVFAGYVDMMDEEIGRLVKAVEESGKLDNTLIFYIAGDNGTSAEGTMNGVLNEMTYFNGVSETVDELLKHYDDWGSSDTYPHMSAGWAVAFDAPFTWTKQVASNYGGTRQGMVVHWPEKIKDPGGLRRQWHHIIDITPTVLEAAGLPQPRIVNGVGQKPIEGVSMAYSWNNPGASDRHLVQYFEIIGNRGIYYDGWFAGTLHLTPWGDKPLNSLENDKWELYHVADDFSMSEDLASKYPDKLAELQSLFMAEAVKHQVLPLDDRRIERTNSKVAGRPDIMGDRKSLTLYSGAGFLLENGFINTKNCSFEILAEVDVKDGKANGVLVSQGGQFGGWSFYLKDGKPAYTYNFLGREMYTVASDTALAPGKSTIKLDFAYEGGRRGAGGTATISINGNETGSGKIGRTQPNIFSADETANVGIDRETPVVPEAYADEEASRFNGAIEKVTINLK